MLPNAEMLRAGSAGTVNNSLLLCLQSPITPRNLKEGIEIPYTQLVWPGTSFFRHHCISEYMGSGGGGSCTQLNTVQLRGAPLELVF